MGQIGPNARPFLIAYANLLGGICAFDQLGRFQRRTLAQRIFGREAVYSAIEQICNVLADWGYHRGPEQLTSVICQTLLLNRSPLLTDLTTSALTQLPEHQR